MLMHLKFCFESIPNKPTSAAMLRYYRQHKGLTTRQLAESVGIVPATLLMYEREKFPIPYQTAVAFADILKIDKNLLFDDFARFMDYPYSNFVNFSISAGDSSLIREYRSRFTLPTSPCSLNFFSRHLSIFFMLRSR